MPGNIGLVAIECSHERTDGGFSCFKLLQGAKAIRLSECAETPRHEVEHFVTHRWRGHDLDISLRTHTVVRCGG